MQTLLIVIENVHIVPTIYFSLVFFPPYAWFCSQGLQQEGQGTAVLLGWARSPHSIDQTFISWEILILPLTKAALSPPPDSQIGHCDFDKLVTSWQGETI